MDNFDQKKDDELVSLVREGCQEAYAAIYRRYYHTVFGISRKYLICQHDAEDIAQEVFLRVLAMNKIIRFRGESSLRTWLVRIAINLCYSKHRKRTEKPLREDGRHLPPVLTAIAPNPEEMAISSEIRQQLYVALWKLPKKYQTAIALYYHGQQPYRTIAQRLKKSVGSIGVCLKRGRMLLQRKLAYRGVWA